MTSIVPMVAADDCCNSCGDDRPMYTPHNAVYCRDRQIIISGAIQR